MKVLNKFLGFHYAAHKLGNCKLIKMNRCINPLMARYLLLIRNVISVAETFLFRLFHLHLRAKVKTIKFYISCYVVFIFARGYPKRHLDDTEFRMLNNTNL